ncbi:monofunctional biosynthetic peptidoglycan transglycosylase [Actinobacillus equuli]|nr:monofunctional biosynthetic peptidoglycan transglycosylase [Actinobacillus equuli]
MAKRKRKRKKKSVTMFSLIKRLCRKLLKFFIPQEISSRAGWLWFGSSRLGAGLGGLSLHF